MEALPAAFTHIFAGGDPAGYYSYLWAELLSAYGFDRISEARGICPETLTTDESFAAFRGRERSPGRYSGATASLPDKAA